jgi:hypothetical protein
MKRMSNWVKGLLGLAALVTCGLALSGCFPSAKEIPFETVSECPDSYYESHEPALVVVLGRTELGSLPRLMSPYGFDLERALDKTDFSVYYLLVAFHGQEMSGGYRIETLNIQQSSGQIEVKARFTSPESGAILSVTSPCDVVRMKRTDIGSGKFTFILIDDSSGKKVARTTYTLP